MNYNIANMFATPVMRFEFKDHKDNLTLLKLINSWQTGKHALVSGAESSYLKGDKHILDHEDGSFVHCKDIPTADRAEEKVDIIGAQGGARATNPLIIIREELIAAGFEASIVEGPLLLATTGGNKPALKDMPLGTGSGGDPMKELLTQAAFNLKGKDEELDVEAGREAKWSSHSLRRLADTTRR